MLSSFRIACRSLSTATRRCCDSPVPFGPVSPPRPAVVPPVGPQNERRRPLPLGSVAALRRSRVPSRIALLRIEVGRDLDVDIVRSAPKEGVVGDRFVTTGLVRGALQGLRVDGRASASATRPGRRVPAGGRIPASRSSLRVPLRRNRAELLGGLDGLGECLRLHRQLADDALTVNVLAFGLPRGQLAFGLLPSGS